MQTMDLQRNTFDALCMLATDVESGKFGSGNDIDIDTLREEIKETLSFILED